MPFTAPHDHDHQPRVPEHLFARPITRRHWLKLTAFTSLGTALAGCTRAPGAQPTQAAPQSAPATVAPAAAARTLKLGHGLSTESHYQVAAQQFADVLAQKTGGAIQAQIYPQGQIGQEVQMIDALRTGTQDVLITSQGTVENTVKEWQVFDLPYLFNSLDQANATLRSAAGQKFLDMLPRYNLYGLSWLSAIERNVYTAKTAVRSVGDMRGLRLRVVQAAGYIAAYKALGANPTPLAYNEVYLALQQGTVDGGESSPDQIVQDKFVEVAKYYTLARVTYLPAVLLIARKAMDDLTPDQQSAVREAAGAAAEADIQSYKQQFDRALSDMKARGVEIIQVDLGPWIDKTASVKSEVLPSIPGGQELYDALREAAQ